MSVDEGSPWRHRDFRLIWAGQTVSLIGSQVTVLALPLAALGLKASTFQVSLLTAFSSLPFLLVSLPAGVVVDRCRRRSVMLCADLLRAALLGSVPIAELAGALTLWQLYAVSLAVGCCTVFFDSAYLSFPATLLERDQLVAANSMISSANALAGVAGPNLSGFVVGLIGAARTITLDAFSFLASALSLLLVKHREPAPEPAPPAERGLRRELLEGLRVIGTNRALGSITASNAIGNMMFTAILAIWTPYAIRELDWSARTLGMVMGASALGSVAATIVAQPLIKRYGLARILLFSQFPVVPAWLAAGLAPKGLGGQFMAAAGLMVGLVAAVLYNIAQRTYRVTACESRLLGRVNATTMWLQLGIRPIAALLGGGLGTLLGLQPTIICCAVLLVFCPVVLWTSPLRREVREGPAPEPEPAADSSEPAQPAGR
ncbi:MFS transporter [Kitasatospora acidiphila]|uniref:MFS transporter n=1 Tax=Kitasatospora acidiphila TaxID=2567942 RepID=A0A540W0L4_9ACTN|nr:MFS transporter [Kitasatospora acidiphila]TQF02560.1 MFS transporter [Kitasatospora acidiphila]